MQICRRMTAKVHIQLQSTHWKTIFWLKKDYFCFFLELFQIGWSVPKEIIKNLFKKIICRESHIMQPFLPEVNNYRYSLRPRWHHFILATKSDSCNFTTKTVVYWHLLNFLVFCSTFPMIIFYSQYVVSVFIVSYIYPVYSVTFWLAD